MLERALFYKERVKHDCTNLYLSLFNTVVTLSSFLAGYSTSNFPKEHADRISVNDLNSLKTIKETPGLGRCWGYARSICDIIEKWRAGVLEEKKSYELLTGLTSSLENSLLEVLPAYYHWIPSVVVPENIGLINFLNDRCNKYRKTNNQKFYAYDKVIQNLAQSRIVITRDNYKFIKGIGPKMSKHVLHYLLQEPAWETFQWPVKLKETPLLPNEEFGSPVPSPKESDNTGLLTYLWNLSNASFQKGALENASSIRRAAHTVRDTKLLLRFYVNVLCTSDWVKELFPCIDEEIKEIIKEYYQFEEKKGVTIQKPSSPNAFKTQLINLLWDTHPNVAGEIVKFHGTPFIKSDFMKMQNYTPEIITMVFSSDVGEPVCRNWTNKPLVKWLWSNGYTDLADVISHKITHTGLHSIKNVSNEILTHASKDFYGVKKRSLGVLHE